MIDALRAARRRAVITGLGAITPLGESVTKFWDGLVAGRSGIGPMTLADPRGSVIFPEYWNPSSVVRCSKLRPRLSPFDKFIQQEFGPKRIV